MTPHERRQRNACASVYTDIVLMPRATCMAQYRRRVYTAVSLYCMDWVVATMLVENFANFVEVIDTWMNTVLGELLWRAERHNGVWTAMFGTTPAPEMFPRIETCKRALLLARRQDPWTVRQNSKVAAGGALIGMPPNYNRNLGALVVHNVITLKQQEPVVEAYFVPDSVGSRPSLDPYLFRPMRVLLAFHDLVSLAANSVVWALTTSPVGVPQRLARVVPRGLLPASAEMPDVVPNTVLKTCEGLDVRLENGERQDILSAALYSYPRPRKPRKCLPKKLFNGIYYVSSSAVRV